VADLAKPVAPWILDGLAELQAVEPGHSDILVAILDGPVQHGHPVLAGTGLCPAAAAEEARSDHGTHVASVILGREVGIAPGCSGISIPVYSEDESGALVACDQADLALAIDQALEAGAALINISGGVLSPTGRAEFLLEQAVERCRKKNALIVAAVGNEGMDGVHVPAGLPGVLAVGAAGLDGQPLPFNNFGRALRRQGLLAPGVDIPGAAPPDRLVLKTGTSFATPIVTAVAALLISQQLRRDGQTDVRAVREALLDCATGCLPGEDMDTRQILKGRLNIPGTRTRLFGPVSREPIPSIQPTARKEKAMSDVTPSEIVPAEAVIAPAEAAIVPAEAPVTALQVIPAAVPPTPAPAPNHAAPAAPRPRISGFASLADAGIVPAALAADGRARPSGIAAAPGEQVFVLGSLSYDFGTEARMDYFIQQMGGASNILDPVKMASRLQSPERGGEGHTDEAEALIWTLNIDNVPVYAIEPDSQFAVICFLRLVEFLFQQEKEGVERVSIAGRIKGRTRLYNGTVVPTISPTLRGMYNWSTHDLTDAVIATMDKLNPDEEKQVRDGVAQFLQRVYYEMRNPGITPEERSLNFAATNAFHAGAMFKEMASQSMVLDKIGVTRSPISRPDSDCWDVDITFFNPAKIMEQARKVYRVTVDVSDEVPVTVGDPRSWFVYFGSQR